MNCRLRRRLSLVVRLTVGDAEIAWPNAILRNRFRLYPVPGGRWSYLLIEGEEGRKRIVKLLEGMREAIGPDRSLMIDCSSRWHDVDYTIEMARRLEHVNLYWIEEPLSPDNLTGYERLVREVNSNKFPAGSSSKPTLVLPS